MNDRLHIVCLDAPAPPSYGGAIDMYYKIIALSDSGKKISLHYFNYSKKRNIDSIKKYCLEVYSYKRKNFLQTFPFTKPFIVASRINHDLIRRLNQDRHPILLEGIHCAGIIKKIHNPERVVLRIHNDEAIYYKNLAKTEKNWLKQIYFLLESVLLNKFQKGLKKNIKLAALSLADINFYQRKYSFTSLHFIPCFIPWQSLHTMRGMGTYCLYHGNMEISENEAAAEWLIKNVFSSINTPFIIAGRSISKSLHSMGKTYKHITLISNPSIDELDALIRNAHVNILPSFNNTGVKLKLIHALFEGRFCLSNDSGIKGSGLTNEVLIANDPESIQSHIEALFKREFTEKDIAERKAIVTIYNNKVNAEKLNELW